MKTGQNKRKIDNLLVLLLFSVFAVCILSVLLTGADIYQRLSSRDQHSYDRRTAAQYLTTRVRQADRLGDMCIERFETQDALVFTEVIDGNTYETLVYCYDGYLRELFVAADGSFLPEDGEKVLAAQDLTIRQAGQLLDMELTGPSGEVQALHLYLRSREGAAECETKPLWL